MGSKDYILSYFDSLIRQEDYDLLFNRRWINDVIIEFCFEYYKREEFKEFEDEFCYLGPSLTQLIKMSDPEVSRSILESMVIQDKKLVLIALNDETSITKCGGSHWSLLVYYPNINQVEHYDSSHGEGNQYHAQDFYNKLIKATNNQIEDPLIHAECVPQNDSYNCGIHLISNANAILKKVFQNDHRKIIEIANETFIKNMRKHIANLIDELSKQSSNE